ncbi:MAG: iron chaperone [Tenuifilaceae bacterium]
MKLAKLIPRNIDEYIAQYPKDIQLILEKIRKTIRNEAPDAEETINYQIPTFKLKGNLVHFAAYKNHIGFYPGSTGIDAFKEELSFYKHSKGSIQFPLEKPIPIDLIAEIVKFRVIVNLEKDNLKPTKRKK